MKTDGTIELGMLSKQLKEQGWDDDNGHFQRDADALSRLAVRNLISQSVSNKARDKLCDRIAKHNGMSKRKAANP